MICACSPAARRWQGTPGRCDNCDERTDRLSESEMQDLCDFYRDPRVTAVVAEVRERRAKERAE